MNEDSQPDMLPRYDPARTYEWNYEHAPAPANVRIPPWAGSWSFLGLSIGSPLGVAAGPLLNGRWVRYYASLGFDVLVYKTVRSRERVSYPLPNLLPVESGPLTVADSEVRAGETMSGTWAVSFGMPSRAPEAWRADVAQTRRELSPGQALVVSVVATTEPDWTIEQVADDYAQCARWAVEAGADAIETNFSCPNVATCDGQLYQDPASAALVAERVRAAIGRTPLAIKIGFLPDGAEAERLIDALAPTADALATTNTVTARVTGADGRVFFGGERRGIGGRAILAACVDQVSRLARIIERRRVPLKLIGVGGAATASDVRAYLDAGAESVHLATAAMINPLVAAEIRRTWDFPPEPA